MQTDSRFVDPELNLAHNNLASIQGGITGEHYHLTKGVHDNVVEFSDIAQDILDNNITMNHNDLQGIQGGAVDDDGGTIEAYHSTSIELAQVQFLLEHYAELVDMLS